MDCNQILNAILDALLDQVITKPKIRQWISRMETVMTLDYEGTLTGTLMPTSEPQIQCKRNMILVDTPDYMIFARCLIFDNGTVTPACSYDPGSINLVFDPTFTIKHNLGFGVSICLTFLQSSYRSQEPIINQTVTTKHSGLSPNDKRLFWQVLKLYKLDQLNGLSCFDN